MIEIPIRCSFNAMAAPSSLEPHPKNPNMHPPEQLEVFAAILRYQGWRRPITVSKLSGYVTKGHGALATALAMGLESVPIDWQEYEDEAAELADLVADNQLQRLSHMDTGALKTIVNDLGVMREDFNLRLTALSIPDLAQLGAGGSGGSLSIDYGGEESGGFAGGAQFDPAKKISIVIRITPEIANNSGLKLDLEALCRKYGLAFAMR